MTAHTRPASLRVMSASIANYAPEPGELVQCDASGGGGPFAFSLPANARVNDRICVKQLDAGSRTSATVAGNSHWFEYQFGDPLVATYGTCLAHASMYAAYRRTFQSRQLA